MEEFFELQSQYKEEFEKFAHEYFEIIKKYKLSNCQLAECNITDIVQNNTNIEIEFYSSKENKSDFVKIPIELFNDDVDKEYSQYLKLKSKFEVNK